MSYTGIVLTEEDENKSAIATLGDEVESEKVETNEELADIIREVSPNIIAVNTGLKETRKMSEKEEELQEQGHIFTPAYQDNTRVRRFQDLKRRLEQSMAPEDVPEFIRFDSVITGRELALEDDKGLKSLSVETSDINSSKEFDAVLGAVTARFHSQGQTENMDVVVPQTLKDESDEDSKGL